jgi:four helix bundle protein
MNQAELKQRTKNLALRVIRLVESLPKSKTSNVVGNQLLRNATSVGANYRAACRAKSTADFIAKLAIVEEEADESIYWIELLVESKQVETKLVTNLLADFDEVVAIIVRAIKKTKLRRNPKSQIRIPK